MAEPFTDTLTACTQAYDAGHVDLALDLARRATTLAAHDPTLSVIALRNEARLLEAAGAHMEAAAQLEQAIEAAASHRDGRGDLGDLHLNAGRALARAGTHERAVAHLQRAVHHLASAEARLDALDRLARSGAALGWHEVAVAACQEQVGLCMALYDLEDPRTLRAVLALAAAHQAADRPADAAELYGVVDDAVGLPDQPRTPAQTAQLGEALLGLGTLQIAASPDTARTNLRRALACLSDVAGPTHPSVCRARLALGLVARDLGELAQARSHWEEALAQLSGDDSLRARLEHLLAAV